MLAALPALLVAAAQPTVTLHGLGRLAGLTEETPAGVSVDRFLGVPYAQPPVGDLRFRAPVDAEPWTGVRNATEFGNTCLGSNCEYVGGVDDESCLFLNVYRPTGGVPCKGRPGRFGAKCNRNLPVMVYFHGGSFDNGCGNEVRAENWVAASVANGRPVVAVTFNYRFGVLGYLGSDLLRNGNSSESTGNYGTLDQRKVLVWIQTHISKFGGNPRQVTLVGESAGAAAISVHMVSEASYGTRRRPHFRRVVAESGLAPVLFGHRDMSQAQQIFAQVAGGTGCAAAPDVAQCLRSLPQQAVQFLITQLPGRIFAPLIDGVVLKDAPWRLLRDGKFAPRVSVLEGTMRDEHAFFLLGDANELAGNATEAEFDVRVMREIGTGPQAQFLLQQIKAVYSNESHNYPPVSEWGGRSYWWWAFLRGVTDRVFVCPGRYASRAIARGPHALGESEARRLRAPVFNYLFSGITRTRTPISGTGPSAFTAGHATIIPYTFNCSSPSSCLNESSKATCEMTDRALCAFDNEVEQRTAEYFSTTLARYAAVGRPGCRFRKLALDAPSFRVLQIESSPQDGGVMPIFDHRRNECAFWDAVDRPAESSTTSAADEYTTLMLQHKGL